MAKAELGILLEGTTLKTAQTKWAAVESACSGAGANSALMEYVAHLRGLYPTSMLIPKKGDAATRETNFLNHLNTVFEFVGYPAPAIPGGIYGPLQAGILAVIPPGSGGPREFRKSGLGGFYLPVQDGFGDARGHLFAMYPTNQSCLSVDNLRKLSNCVQVNSYPAASPKFSPGIEVGVCVPVSLSGGAVVLGHEKKKTSTTTETEIPVQLDIVDPEWCHTDLNIASSSNAFQRALTRFASFGRKTLGIRQAYATDKGLGGIGSTLSGWGAVDVQTFASSFDPPRHVVGSPPDTMPADFRFTYAVTPPGSIVVQSSLGNSTSGPLVVLSQGGGACAACGGLELRAHFFSASGSAADDGIYEVNWRSVQAAPSVKAAPFVIRGAGDSVVARLTYVTSQSQNQLLYNGQVVGTWVRNEVQTFKVIVNLNTNRTKISVHGGPFSDEFPFVDGGNTMSRLAAEFSGIDSGVMGWDEIGVHRMIDTPPSN